MENYDAEMAQRVWQRVRGEQSLPAGPANLQGLIAAEAEAAAAYTRLARQLPDKAGRLHQMAEDSRRHGACLRGIRYLCTGDRVTAKLLPARQETTETALRRCYGQSLRSATEYHSRTDDQQYGHVFAAMADKKREHCRTLLEIIGSVHK